jgi:PAS domain S-box-containing protein
MSKKSDYAQVIAAFALPLVLVGVAGWFAWSDTWERAEGELSRTADAAAELADRVFSSAILAARLTNTLLTGVSDDELRENEYRYHQQVAGILAELSGSNMISVSDHEGLLTIMSGQFPASRVSVADREWVKALQASDPPEVHVGTLSVGRVAGLPFFSVSIPRSGSGNEALADEYEGNINVSLDPLQIARELRSSTHEESDLISLVREDGEILTSTRGNWMEVSRVPSASPLLTLIRQGADRGIYEGQSLGLREGLPLGRGIKIAFKQVDDLPVYATVSRTPKAILAPWLRTMTVLLAVGLPTSLALGFLSLTSLRHRNALRKSEAELHAAFENAATGNALVDGKTNRILKVNSQLCEIAGRDPIDLIGFTVDGLLDAPMQATGSQLVDRVGAVSRLYRLQRPDGSIRWIELGAAPVTSSRLTNTSLLIATFHDITERVQSQERQLLLAREVDHRAKNVLAIVQAIVRMERNSNSEAYVKRVEGRILALGRAHELLAKEGWQGVSLKCLLDEELAAYQTASPFLIDGSDVVISPEAVQPLSMVLHELATNSVKHGALAKPTGNLSVSWSVHLQTGELELHWLEELKQEVSASHAPGGFGFTIIQGSVEQLGGKITFDWRETGLACRIILPSIAMVKGVDTHVDNTDALPDRDVAAETNKYCGLRVLLAEDEVIVAMDMQDMLEQNGCEVIGPAYNLEEARRLADLKEGRIDVAVLDVNLKGDASIELARDLGRAGVGVILVTGYSEIAEKKETDSWIQLRKPVSETVVIAALQKISERAPKDSVGASAI